MEVQFFTGEREPIGWDMGKSVSTDLDAVHHQISTPASPNMEMEFMACLCELCSKDTANRTDTEDRNSHVTILTDNSPSEPQRFLIHS